MKNFILFVLALFSLVSVPVYAASGSLSGSSVPPSSATGNAWYSDSGVTIPYRNRMMGEYGNNYYPDYGHNHGYSSEMMYEYPLHSFFVFHIVWVIVCVAVIIAIIRRIIWGKRSGCRFFGSCSSTSAAMEILKERYAKGEIAKAEFEEKKKDLLQ